MSSRNWKVSETRIILYLILGVLEIQYISAGNSLPCTIRGSHLSSFMWYTIDMKLYTPGYLIWSGEENKQGTLKWYLQHIFDLSDVSMYEKDGDFYERTLWRFVPSEEHPGWYKLRNRRFLDFFVTWSRTKFVEKNVANYLTLEDGREEEDYMIKPVLASVSRETRQEYYQLRLKRYPNGKVTWIPYTSTAHFIKNDNRNTTKYEKGNKLYEDTLFIFNQVEAASGEKEDCEGNSAMAQTFIVHPLVRIIQFLFLLKAFNFINKP